MRGIVSLALVVLVTLNAGAVSELGDAAAPLNISEWLKGGPEDLAEGLGKKVYVIEFWATWCAPCKTSIPHLSKIQAKFKDRGVRVIGISDETRSKVERFVAQMGSQMEYAVALDNNRQTTAGYMGAFGQSGIPHAFIVDATGAVAWHGHPMNDLEGVLSKILDGEYDIQAAKDLTRAKELLAVYARLIFEGSDKAKADEVGEAILAKGKPDSDFMNQFAWSVLTDPNIKYRDLDLALRVARVAYDGTQGKNASIVDTYARALYEAGDLEKAIAYQEQAVALCTDHQLKDIFSERLEKYRKEASR